MKIRDLLGDRREVATPTSAKLLSRDGDPCQSYGYRPPLHGAVQNPVACRTLCGRSSQLGCHRCECLQCHGAQSDVTRRVLNEHLEAVLARWQLRRPRDVADYVPKCCLNQPDHGGFVGHVHFRGPLTGLDAGPKGERQGQCPHGPGGKSTVTLGRLALLHDWSSRLHGLVPRPRHRMTILDQCQAPASLQTGCMPCVPSARPLGLLAAQAPGRRGGRLPLAAGTSTCRPCRRPRRRRAWASPLRGSRPPRLRW